MKSAEKKGAQIDAAGYDAGKKVKGKERHTPVDTLGLSLLVIVDPADIQDRDGGVLSLSTLSGCSDSSKSCLPMGAIRGRNSSRPLRNPA